jgi:hypothetical protein
MDHLPCWTVLSALAKLLISCELMTHCKEDSKYLFPEIKLRGLVPNFRIHTFVSELFIPRIGPPILLQPNTQTYSGNI